MGGVHGDPGEMMDAYDNIVTTTSGSTKTTTFDGAPVTNDAVRAIMGRMNMTKTLKDGISTSPYGITDSKYLTTEERKKITDVSNGTLKSIR